MTKKSDRYSVSSQENDIFEVIRTGDKYSATAHSNNFMDDDHTAGGNSRGEAERKVRQKLND